MGTLLPAMAVMCSLLLGSNAVNASQCRMTRKFSSNSQNGQLAANIQDFSPCVPTCQCIEFKSLKCISPSGDLRAYDHDPIPDCGSNLNQDYRFYFCWNRTDDTIRSTIIFEKNNIDGYSFTYKIKLRKLSKGGASMCYLTIDVVASVKSTWFPQPQKNNTTPATKPYTGVPKFILNSNKETSRPLRSGQGKVEFQCKYKTGKEDSMEFQWLKDSVPVQNFPGNITYMQENRTILVDDGKSFLVTQFLEVILNKPETQGYYKCRLQLQNGTLVDGNSTLLWFTDVSTTKYQVSIISTSTSNQTVANFNAGKGRIFQSVEYSFETLQLNLKRNILVQKQLKILGLKNEAKLFCNGMQRNGSISIMTVLIYYTNISQVERLNICKKVFKQRRKLRLTSFDCCPASITGYFSPTGRIRWPTSLLGEVATVKCPYSRTLDNVIASRQCTINFLHGPQWEVPLIKNCPQKSETTRKLGLLSEKKLNKGNIKMTTRELRQLTRNASKLNDVLDIMYSIDTIENALRIGDLEYQVGDEILGTASNLMNIRRGLLLSGQRSDNTSTRLLASIEKVADDLQINKTFLSKQENIACGINIINDVTIDRGLNINACMNKSANFLEVSFDETGLTNYKAHVFLSPSMLRRINATADLRMRKITSVVFKTSILFEHQEVNETNLDNIESNVMSVTVNGRRVSGLNGDEEIQNYFKPFSADVRGKRKCVYWNAKARDGLGGWSTKGCSSKGFQNGMFRCSCNHLTNFAILLDVTSQPLSKPEIKSLSVITYIGCSISLVSLIITVSTYLAFRKLRRTLPSRILICLSISLMMTMVIFLGGSLVKSHVACGTIAVLLHYFVLASFCWMAVEAFNIYRCFVIVFKTTTSKFFLKANMFAWGCPLIVVTITSVLTKLENYSRQRSDNWICTITGLPFYVSYLSPIALILLVNFIVLIITIRTLSVETSISRRKRMNGKSKARIAATFSVLLGCSWVFGLIAILDVKFVFQLLFCVFSSLQGFFILVFFTLRSEDVRKEWLTCWYRLNGSCLGKQHIKHMRNETVRLDNFLTSRSESSRSLRPDT